MNVIKIKYGELRSSGVIEGPDNEFFWFGNFEISSKIYTGDIDVHILTKNQNISEKLIKFSESIVLEAERNILNSIIFLKNTLSSEPEKYNIKKDEIKLLQLSVEEFPVGLPQFIFWDNGFEWAVHFAEGKFDICDPYGIIVHFDSTNPVSIENIEDAEPC